MVLEPSSPRHQGKVMVPECRGKEKEKRDEPPFLLSCLKSLFSH